MQYIKRTLTILACMIFLVEFTTSQNLSSSRGTSLAASIATTNDLSSIDWNPASLIFVKDWRFDLTNYYNSTIKTSGVNFLNFGVTKKFLNNYSASIRYSPGATLQFIVPTTFVLFDPEGNLITTKFDKKISYNQFYSLGYAFKILPEFSLGISTKYYDINISDTKYSLDTNNFIQSQIIEKSSGLWVINWGSIYNINQDLTIGLLFKNMIAIKEKVLPEDLRDYELELTKLLGVGASYRISEKLLLALDFDSRKDIRCGIEFSPLNLLQLRTGLFSSETKRIEAGTFGIGYNLQNFQIDISYLKFFNQNDRKGVSNITSFYNSNNTDIDYTNFTPDRLSVSLGINLGRIKQPLVKIEYVELFSEVFPVAHQTYAFRPIGKVRLKNISSSQVEARVSFYINKVMDEPTQSKPVKIFPGELTEVPIFAVFNKAIQMIKEFSILDGNVYVNAEPAGDYDDSYQTRVVIRGRNDWNGDVTQLRYFITPNDPEVMKFSRTKLRELKIDSIKSIMLKFEQAKFLFNELSKVISYVSDPKQSTDFVQYPAETLNLHGGDCDDITVSYSAILESIGITTALIDVVPQDNSQNAHIYLMFDTNLPPENSYYISDNPKRYIIRRNSSGNETIWIPVETTLISQGFEEAWNRAASQFFTDVVLNNGIQKGWVRIVDLQLNY